MRIQRLNINNSYICTIAIANNPFLRLRGMLGRHFASFNALAIIPCNQIHTQFMSFPIDVFYANKEGVILKTEEYVKPWKFCKLVKGARTTIEMPAGSISRYNIKVGDKFDFS